MPNLHGCEPIQRVEVKAIYDYECARVSEKKKSAVCHESVLFSSRAHTSRRPWSFDASPSVSWVTPCAVQRRYECIAWYVSARICEEKCLSVSPTRENPEGEGLAFPFSTRTEARMSSGSPMRSSVKGEGERQVTGKVVLQTGRLLTIYMHPAIVDSQCSGHLDVINGLRKSLGYHLMKKQ